MLHRPAREWRQLGVREKLSTISCIDWTCSTIARHPCDTTVVQVRAAALEWRAIRSAASRIGVSGFLIWWAMRRATSLHAAWRWARRSCVRSSSATTHPSGCSARPSGTTAISRCRATPPG